MATCNDCGQEMLTAKSCTYTHVKIGDRWYKRVTDYHDINQRCHDCGIVNGKVHHFGCDMERCPMCRGQLFCCDCDIKAVGYGIQTVAQNKKILRGKDR